MLKSTSVSKYYLTEFANMSVDSYDVSKLLTT